MLGLVANRSLSVDLDDFLLYGRKARFFVLYLTIVATYHSAFAFLGSSGFFYTHGIGFWVAGTWTVVTGAITYVIGPRIWALGKKFDYMTPADMMADFYESEPVRVVVAAVSIVFTILYIQVQAQGLGYIVSAASGDRRFIRGRHSRAACGGRDLSDGRRFACRLLDRRAAGGLDVRRRLGRCAGAVVRALRWAAAAASGGQGATTRPADDSRATGFFTYPMWFGMMVTLSFGVVLQPHLLIRYYTAVDARTLRWLGATIPIFLVSLFIPTVFVGLGGALVMPDIAIPDRIFPELLFAYAPAWLTGLILAGATAAAMSTLDSILHANTAVLTRDIYQRYINADGSRAHYIAVSRFFIVCLLIIGYILSVYTFDQLVIVVTLSGAGALQLLPALAGVLFPSRRCMTATGVLTGIGAGLVTLFFTLVVWPHPLTMHGGVWGLAANWLVAWAVSRVTPKPSAATVNRVHGTIEELVYGPRDGINTIDPIRDTGA